MTERERPTVAVQRVDVSASDNRASAAPVTSETALFVGYSRVGLRLETRPCVCGGAVIADPDEPGRGVAAHNYTPRHKAWRVWRNGE